MRFLSESLVVFADDLTGTLDTAVQFAMHGVSVISFPTELAFRENTDWHHQVYVLNTNTRHLPGKQAYEILHRLAGMVRDQGCRFVLKKTDSALRGSIGAELSAVMHAFSTNCMVFAPSYPDMGRCTVGGIHYCGGIPVAETVFGDDPFDPVLHSDVASVIAQTCNVRVENIAAGTDMQTPHAPVIFVADAQTNDDLKKICRDARRLGNPVLLAGCAGIANALAEMLEPAGQTTDVVPHISGVLVISGSLNQITMKQIQYLSLADYPVRLLYSDYELKSGFESTPDCDRLVQQVCADLKTRHVSILATAGTVFNENNAFGDSDKDTAARSIAEIAKRILIRESECALVVFGGDTLLSIVSEIFTGSLLPLAEIMPGVPVSLARFRKGGECLIATRSGGFGNSDSVELILNYFKEKGAAI